MMAISDYLIQGCQSILRGEADVLWVSDDSKGYVGITVEKSDERTVWTVETDHDDKIVGEGDELPVVDGTRIELLLQHPASPVRKRLIIECKHVVRIFLKREGNQEGDRGFEVTLWEASR